MPFFINSVVGYLEYLSMPMQRSIVLLIFRLEWET